MEISGWTVNIVHYYLGVFRELMPNPEWRHHFDLTIRPCFDEAGNCLIGPPFCGLWWECIQKNLPAGAAVGTTQLYFDETFQKQNQGPIQE